MDAEKRAKLKATRLGEHDEIVLSRDGVTLATLERGKCRNRLQVRPEGGVKIGRRKKPAKPQ